MVRSVGSFMTSIEALDNPGIQLIGKAVARQGGGCSARLTD